MNNSNLSNDNHLSLSKILPIQTTNGKQAISARLLHEFLGSKRQFANWIKSRIDKYGFIENEDYAVLCYDYQGNLLTNRLNKNVKPENQGVAKIDYACSLDMAKELSMVENNEKGRMARKYFIACEKELLNTPHVETPEQIMARALVVANDTLRRQRDKIEADAPKVLFADAVQTSKTSCLVGELSKILSQNGIKIGQIRLFEWMRSHGYLCSKGEMHNQPTQKAIEMKLFELKKTTITKPDGSVLTKTTTKVTGKGQIYFVNKFLGISGGNSNIQGIPASRLELLRQVADGAATPLPDYVPANHILRSATDLLRDNGAQINTIEFNRLLVQHGYLEVLTRRASHGAVKSFKHITDMGLEFGENRMNPKYPTATQPLWYADRFPELLAAVNAAAMGDETPSLQFLTAATNNDCTAAPEVHNHNIIMNRPTICFVD